MRRLTRRAFLAAAASGLLAGCAGGQGSAEGSSAAAQGPARETVYDREAPAEPVRDEVSVCMVGDILVHTYVWKSGEQADGTRNYDGLFDHVRECVEGYDLAMLDQETILGGTAFPYSGFPTFNSPQEIGDAEVAAGFDAMLHASNHSMDMGFAGIEADLAFWAGHHPEALVTGIYDTEEASTQIPMVERSGHRIAILNYTATTNGIPLPADKPWCVNMLDESRVESDFARARELGAEAIIACPHCGTEYAEGPDEVQTAWARRFVDLGADAVICNHAHVVQPVTWYDGVGGKKVPVFWSLGNFVSTMTRDDAMIGGMAHVTLAFEGGECSVSAAGLTPLVTHKVYGPQLSTYLLRDYTEELAAANAIRNDAGCGGFSRQWCVEWLAGRLGEGFDRETCEFTLA